MRYIFMFLTIINIGCFAQSGQWAFQSGYASGSRAEASCADNSGHVYVIVNMYNKPIYGGKAIPPGVGTVLAQHDSSGNVIWARKIVGSCTDIAVDRTGNIFLTGIFGPPCNFQGTTSSLTIYGTGGGDSFVAKYDTTGQILWAHSYGYTDADDRAATITATQSGSCIIAGISHKSPSSAEYFINKYDPNGILLWTKNSSWGGSGISSISADSDENIYITGHLNYSLNFGSILLTSPNPSTLFIAKMNPAGTFEWAKLDGGSASYSLGSDIEVTDEGFYLSGQFSGNACFGPHCITDISSPHANGFIAYYDLDGNNQWAIPLGVSGHISVHHTVLGGCHISGNFFGTISLTGRSGPIDLVAASLHGDTFFARVLSNGNFLWASKPINNINYPGSSLDLSGNDQGQTYICGSFADTLVFSADSLMTSSTTAYHYSDMFLVRIDDHMHEPLPVTGMDEPNTGDFITIAPNPSQNMFLITLESASAVKKIRISMSDVTGKLVCQYEDSDIGTSYRKIIDAAALGKGIYFITIIADDKKTVKKLVID